MGKTIRVLLCEDDPSIRKQLAKALQREGFEVSEAENGKIGFELFKTMRHEIVLSDLKMPEIDGVEVLRRVKELSPETQVILMTGFGDINTAITTIRQGALDYLKKPIDLDLLLTAMGRAMEKIEEIGLAKGNYPAVLLAEDDPGTRKALKQALEREDWKVFEAGDGAEAIKLFSENKIDIVLLDINMPKMTGLEALHEMRGMGIMEFEAIVLSGFGDEEKAIQALREGAMNFIKKPVDVEHLLVSMEKGIQKLKDKRALKCRTREVELARQVIARIEVEKNIFIDMHSLKQESSMAFLQKLFNAFPMAFFVVDKEKNIKYSNSGLSKHFETAPRAIDEAFVKNLYKIGVKEISLEILCGAIDKLMTSEPGVLEMIETEGSNMSKKNMDEIQTGPFGYMIFVALAIFEKGKRESMVAVAVRGERR